MTSYDEEHSGPDFTPAYGVQLHDPRLLEYVGAPESARLLSRSPEYWLHHMGREKTLSAALQLQHDAELIPSNVQVPLAARHGTESNVVRGDAGCPRSAAVSNERYASGDALLPSSPSGPLYDCDGFMAATYNFGGPGTSATVDV